MKEKVQSALDNYVLAYMNNDKDLFRAGYYKKDNIKIKFDLDFICMEEYIICYAKKS